MTFFKLDMSPHPAPNYEVKKKILRKAFGSFWPIYY